MILFPNPNSNEWINKYNALVENIKLGKMHFLEDAWIGKHHIIPKSIAPELEKDEDNLVELPFAEHMDLHYYLWKADPSYASQLWFGCVYGRKHKLWDLPGGEEEYSQLKKDLHLSRQKKKEAKKKKAAYDAWPSNK